MHHHHALIAEIHTTGLQTAPMWHLTGHHSKEWRSHQKTLITGHTTLWLTQVKGLGTPKPTLLVGICDPMVGLNGMLNVKRLMPNNSKPEPDKQPLALPVGHPDVVSVALTTTTGDNVPK